MSTVQPVRVSADHETLKSQLAFHTDFVLAA